MKSQARINKLFFKKIQIELVGWLIYLSLSIYSALNIASIRYGSPDDLSIASMQFGKTGIIVNSIEPAKQTGRVQQIPFYILNSLGLRENPIYLTQTIKFISAMLILFLFSYLVKKLYGQKISLLTSLILIATFSTTGEYNAINSFPLWFSLAIVTFIASCITFISYLSYKKIRFLILTLLLFSISLLASEIYFVLILIFPLIQIKIEGSNFRISEFTRIKGFYFSLMIFASSYLLVYTIFKLQSNGSYEGTELTFANPAKSLVSTILLSFGQFNIYGLKRLLIEGELEMNTSYFFIFLVLFIVLYFILAKFNKTISRIEFREISTILLMGFGANILLGFTIKYSEIGLVYPLYLHSLISYLFVSLAVAILCIRISNRKFFVILLSMMISITGYMSFVDQSREYAHLRDNQFVFKAFDCLASNEFFIDNVEKQVVSESMQVASKAYTYNYFGEKLGKLLGKEFHFYRNFSEVDNKSPFTVINMSLVDGKSFGTFQTIRGDEINSWQFRISKSTCDVKKAI